MNNEELQNTNQQPNKIKKVIILSTSATLGLILVILLVINFPKVTRLISGDFTSTPIPPTAKSTQTQILAITATQTAPPTPTPSPQPPSAYLLPDLSSLQPPILDLQGSVAVLLNEDTNVLANPDFTHPQWYHSSLIGEQLGGIEFIEPYYATFGPGSVVWWMDVPLDPGLYEIYILDTLYSSAGPLDFQVTLGETLLTPIIGMPHVEYQSSQFENPQQFDLWHSIGVYDLDQINLLSIATYWEARDEFSIVAIDRVLIVRLSDSLRELINQLPQDRYKFVIDEQQADYETFQDWIMKDDALSWNDQFQIMINPPIDTKVTWELPDVVPINQYEIMAWIPEIRGTAEVGYKLLANGNEIPREPIGDPPVTMQGNWLGGKWISLGFWNIPPYYGNYINLTLEMEIKAGTVGDVAIDAISFIKSNL